MTLPRSDVLQGTLDLMVLKTLDTLGAMHGYGIAQRIQQVSENLLQLNQGTLYPALLRLEQRRRAQARGGGAGSRPRPARTAGTGDPPPAHPGTPLSGAAQARAARLDHVEVGRLRQQP